MLSYRCYCPVLLHIGAYAFIWLVATLGSSWHPRITGIALATRLPKTAPNQQPPSQQPNLDRSANDAGCDGGGDLGGSTTAWNQGTLWESNMAGK